MKWTNNEILILYIIYRLSELSPSLTVAFFLFSLHTETYIHHQCRAHRGSPLDSQWVSTLQDRNQNIPEINLRWPKKKKKRPSKIAQCSCAKIWHYLQYFRQNDRLFTHTYSQNLFRLVCVSVSLALLHTWSLIHSLTHLPAHSFSYSSAHTYTHWAKEAGYNQSFWRKSQHAISSAQTCINVVLGTRVSLAWWITRGLTIMEITIDWSFISMAFRFMLGDRSIDTSFPSFFLPASYSYECPGWMMLGGCTLRSFDIGVLYV